MGICERSYLRRRGHSLILYAIAAVLSVSLLPLLLVGPKRLAEWFNLSSVGITIAYVVVVLFASTTMLLVLLHYSTVKKKSVWSALPGTIVAIVTGFVRFPRGHSLCAQPVCRVLGSRRSRYSDRADGLRLRRELYGCSSGQPSTPS